MGRWFLIASAALLSANVYAQSCFRTSVMAPSPFMGNDGEVFRTSEGALYQVVASYEYLYAYYPEVTICPDRRRMMVEDRVIGIVPVQPASRQGGAGKNNGNTPRPAARESSAPNRIVLRVRGCDYFVADGPSGYYLLEWYGGYDPSRGDGIFGDLSGYGFREILYGGGQEGKVYIDDYMLSKDRVLEKMQDKCR